MSIRLAGPADSVARAPLPAPEQLHPGLWRAHRLVGARGRPGDGALPSGFAALDAQLPDAGWPARALTELLLPHPGLGEWRLLAPALAALQRGGHSLMLFDPPAPPCAWALAGLGLDLDRLIVVHSRPGPQATADLFWALEQALRSGHLGAVLAWLPGRVRPEWLRRLQLAAQAHDGAAFLLREQAAAQRPSAAPLRLALSAGGADLLQLAIVKRRGAPLLQPLRLQLPPLWPEPPAWPLIAAAPQAGGPEEAAGSTATGGGRPRAPLPSQSSHSAQSPHAARTPRPARSPRAPVVPEVARGAPGNALGNAPNKAPIRAPNAAATPALTVSRG